MMMLLLQLLMVPLALCLCFLYFFRLKFLCFSFLKMDEIFLKIEFLDKGIRSGYH